MQKQYQIQFVEVKENGLTIENIQTIRNVLSDLTGKDGTRINLVLANAILDSPIDLSKKGVD